jgi:hypothetical protein
VVAIDEEPVRDEVAVADVDRDRGLVVGVHTVFGEPGDARDVAVAAGCTKERAVRAPRVLEALPLGPGSRPSAG